MEIIRSTIFSQFPELLFGMSTQSGGVSPEKLDLNLSFNVGDSIENVKENRNRFFSTLEISENEVAFPLQQHTNNVFVCSFPGKFSECDALITKQSRLPLAISIADCTPVMLYDPVTKTIAGIHAGWRGTASRIVVNSLKLMKEKFSVQLENVFAFIGPSAGKCCYEVGEEVAEQFPKECVGKKNEKKYLLDVKHANLLQLLENGLLKSHIEVHSDCTIHNDKYHSFRRDGKKSGRMLAVIGLR